MDFCTQLHPPEQGATPDVMDTLSPCPGSQNGATSARGWRMKVPAAQTHTEEPDAHGLCSYCAPPQVPRQNQRDPFQKDRGPQRSYAKETPLRMQGAQSS